MKFFKILITDLMTFLLHKTPKKRGFFYYHHISSHILEKKLKSLM